MCSCTKFLRIECNLSNSKMMENVVSFSYCAIKDKDPTINALSAEYSIDI